jgi:uncharacterized protein with ParB-like and HNH nuclease domain
MTREDYWFDKERSKEEISGTIKEYEISSTPNDFNINTIFNFIESGVVEIPSFQRNYVWDKRRASKLIESLIIGIPVPQIFLFEAGKNKYYVIDGQQRLMTIYYFKKQRFPKKEKRGALRRIFNQAGCIPDNILHDDDYFTDFKLDLSSPTRQERNKLHNLKYNTLEEYKSIFDLRTIRNIFIKQISPPEDDSSIFELFNRLNTGGVNLNPQEIRASIYHSDFYIMLNEINLDERWRRIIGVDEPDMHMKDIEILLRGFAMLIERPTYGGSMARFLNNFSKSAKEFPKEKICFLKDLFESFLIKSAPLGLNPFTLKTKKFNISMYESVFVALCSESYKNNNIDVKSISLDRLRHLKNDKDFIEATEKETGRKINVDKRLSRAMEVL